MRTGRLVAFILDKTCMIVAQEWLKQSAVAGCKSEGSKGFL